jgi:hypothetical protein
MHTGVAHCCHHGWIIQLRKRLKSSSNPLQIQASCLRLLLSPLLLLLCAADCCLSCPLLPRMLQICPGRAICCRGLLHRAGIHWLHAACACLCRRATRQHWLLLLRLLLLRLLLLRLRRRVLLLH